MAKMIYLTLNPYLKLLYKSRNLHRKVLNVLFQNLMRMEHFEICILKLISRKLNGLLELKFCIHYILKI